MLIACRDQLQANVLTQSGRYVDTLLTVQLLEANLRRLGTLHSLTTFSLLKILTPLQICKLITLSMPAFPNFMALLYAIGHLAATPAIASPARVADEPERVDKWGLGF